MSRLTVEDKSRFAGNLTRNLGRIEETIPYPFANMSDDDMLQFVNESVPINVRDAVSVLREWKMSNINNILTQRVNIVAADGTGEATSLVRVDIPTASIASKRMVYESSEPELFKALQEYVYHRSYASFLVGKAARWVENAVNSCNSVGQIKRAMPDFAPLFTDWMRSALAEAQRASRMPKDFPHDMYTQLLALNSITVTSLLPPERTQLPSVEVTYYGQTTMRAMRANTPRIFSWQPDDSQLGL